MIVYRCLNLVLILLPGIVQAELSIHCYYYLLSVYYNMRLNITQTNEVYLFNSITSLYRGLFEVNVKFEICWYFLL